jgi:hypothetical protein
MKYYKKRIDELVMMTGMRTAGIAILSTKIEIVDVRNTVVHTKVDSVYKDYLLLNIIILIR